MDFYWYILIFAFIFVVLFFIISYVCYRLTFFVNRKKSDTTLPLGKEYEPYKKRMDEWLALMKNTPHKDLYLTSFDGLLLHAQYYEYKKGALTEILFHGYRGSAERDMCGGVQRCFALGRNALIVDQRASGKSQGKIITFGVNESKDCLSWVKLANEQIGGKFIIGGISMGASTVIIASGMELPSSVVGVIADCGYTTAREMICKIIKKMKLPVGILYFFVKAGARIFGHFDVEKATPIDAVKNCKIPIIFFHGGSDKFIPHEMSERMYDACNSKKRLCIIDKAGHGLCYPVDEEKYLLSLREFDFIK